MVAQYLGTHGGTVRVSAISQMDMQSQVTLGVIPGGGLRLSGFIPSFAGLF